VFDWDRYTIVGTSQEIFKDYLRLTSEPKPETIRPYPVLQRTLTELKKRWKNKESFGTSYNWICNQLKSLRQDLTVCRIHFYLGFSNLIVFSRSNESRMNLRYKYTKFMHALPWRVSVTFFYYFTNYFSTSFQNDMVEYNQCQATLKTLYDLGIPGKVEEFTAYRILMLLHGRNRSGD
jgi:hypothetical protein